MTIEQLIDDLSNLGQTLGLKTEVKAWHLSEQGKPQPQPLDVNRISGCAAGWDKSKKKPVAYLKVV